MRVPLLQRRHRPHWCPLDFSSSTWDLRSGRPVDSQICSASGYNPASLNIIVVVTPADAAGSGFLSVSLIMMSPTMTSGASLRPPVAAIASPTASGPRSSALPTHRHMSGDFKEGVTKKHETTKFFPMVSLGVRLGSVPFSWHPGYNEDPDAIIEKLTISSNIHLSQNLILHLVKNDCKLWNSTLHPRNSKQFESPWNPRWCLEPTSWLPLVQPLVGRRFAPNVHYDPRQTWNTQKKTGE